ncbi:MAG TPA: dolichyl-phosphate beta-glucosyltransferase, partial [Terriglobales bacterium]
NESRRIVPTLNRILSYIAEQGWDAELIVVNDGSRDDTAGIVRGFAERNSMMRLIENPGNRGKGYSVRHGMLNARGDYLLFSDADLSSPIEESVKLFHAMAQGADVAIGSRWLQSDLQTERQPLYRQLFGRIFNVILRLVLGLNFKDTQCGFKAFTRRAAAEIFPRQRIERWGFDPELLFLAGQQGFKVIEVPVQWAHDDKTKISPLRDGTRMFLDVLKVRWNSLTGRYRLPAPTPGS